VLEQSGKDRPVVRIRVIGLRSGKVKEGGRGVIRVWDLATSSRNAGEAAIRARI
jgi:hypothetical protein